MGDDRLVEWHAQEMVLENLRPSSIRQRTYTINRFRRHLGPITLTEAGPMDLAAFLGRDIGPASRAVETTHLRRFYSWCVDVELIELSPARRLKRPRVPKAIPQPIGETDLAMAIQMAPPRIKPWLLLAAYAGLRAGEVANLHAEDLHWDANPPSIFIREGKGGHQGSVPMSDFLGGELLKCDLPLTGPLFLRGDDQPGPNAAHRISQLGSRYLQGLGIDCTFHKLRHRFGTELLRASGGNLRIAQDGLRHASVVSTQVYTLVTATELALACNLLPEVLTNLIGMVS